MKNNFIINGNTLIVYNRKDNREILFDAEDFDIISQSTWHLSKDKRNENSSFYARTNIIVNNKTKKVLANRLVMNFPVNNMVDHMNGNTLDNRKSNLRIANDQINNHNRKNAKGYSYIKTKRKWQARIAINHKQKSLGYYNTESEARTAYLEAKKKYHPTAPIHLWEQ